MFFHHFLRPKLHHFLRSCSHPHAPGFQRRRVPRRARIPLPEDQNNAPARIPELCQKIGTDPGCEHQSVQGIWEVPRDHRSGPGGGHGSKIHRDGLLQYEAEGGNQTAGGPLRVWFFNGTFYLIGLCHTQKAVRIFALDRIRTLRRTGEDFEIPEDFNFEEFIQPSFGVYQGEPVTMKVWFHPDVAGYIEEKIWHESQEIHRQADGAIIYQVRAGGTDEIKYWIMSWGARARVHSPEFLRRSKTKPNGYSGGMKMKGK